jgi:DNA-binding CsgD family transcriptional regulator
MRVLGSDGVIAAATADRRTTIEARTLDTPTSDRMSAPASELNDRLRRSAGAITPRQLECLAWAGDGKSATEIGMILGISARTVEGHLAKVCEALGVRKRIQAAIKARDLGLLPMLKR